MRPSRTFSAIVSWGTSGISWAIALMPWLMPSAGRAKAHGLALEEDRAGVGLVFARGDLGERRLARTVLADECVHLATPEREAHALSAWTPGNDLSMPSSRSSGGVGWDSPG